jgi:hypothetical protein
MMLLTDEEARKQPCPFFRYCYNEQGVIQDKDAALYVHDNCKGSDCKIAWRWEKAPTQAQELGNAPLGYCGIAGRPL